jgi:hypothetical protein
MTTIPSHLPNIYIIPNAIPKVTARGFRNENDQSVVIKPGNKKSRF